MKVSDATIRFRSRKDDRQLYEQAAERENLNLSSWVRRACRGAALGQTMDTDVRRDLVRIRMALNRLAASATDGDTIIAISEMRALLDRRIGPRPS